MTSDVDERKEDGGLPAVWRALGFFRSAIRSGEPWTEECDRIYREAHGELVALETHSQPPWEIDIEEDPDRKTWEDGILRQIHRLWAAVYQLERGREGRQTPRALEPDWRLDGPGVGEIDPPAPSEGEEGEVEPDFWYNLNPTHRTIAARPDHLAVRRGYSHETVQRLQRELAEVQEKLRAAHHYMGELETKVDGTNAENKWLREGRREDWARIHRALGIDPDKTEISKETYFLLIGAQAKEVARLRAQRDAYADPANWEGSYGLDPDHLPRMVPRLTCRYTGPAPSDSTEAATSTPEGLSDDAVWRGLLSDTEADEGESVRGEVAGFEADHPNSVGWLHIATQEERIPFATGTRVRITRLPGPPESEGENDV